MELRVWKHQGLSLFPVPTHSQANAPGQNSPSVSSVWLTGESSWVQVLPLACRAQRDLTQALLSIKVPRQSPWQQTSWIPSDYRNIWINLHINLSPRHSPLCKEQSELFEEHYLSYLSLHYYLDPLAAQHVLHVRIMTIMLNDLFIFTAIASHAVYRHSAAYRIQTMLLDYNSPLFLPLFPCDLAAIEMD